MEKFEHKLRTTVHTRSVEQIMTRGEPFYRKGQQFKLSQPKDNLTTYLRKVQLVLHQFQIDRENLNLAKRIMQCESQHSHDRYVKQWKKMKKFIKVRSHFRPQLSAKQPKIIKIEEMPGRGRLLVKMVFEGINSNMKQLNSHSLYLLKFNLGGSQLIPNKEFLTLATTKGYICQFLAPLFLKDKTITVKLVKVIENNLFQAGRFVVNFTESGQQSCDVFTKMGRTVGNVNFNLQTEIMQKQKCGDRSMTSNKENSMRWSKNIKTAGEKQRTLLDGLRSV